MAKEPSPIKDIDNMRSVILKVKTLHPFLLVNNIRIRNESLYTYLEEIQKQNSAVKDLEIINSHRSASSYEYSESIDVYQKDITNQRVKKCFNDYRIEITWNNLFTGKNKKVIYLKDYLMNEEQNTLIY